MLAPRSPASQAGVAFDMYYRRLQTMRMNVTLPAAAEEFIRRQVASGEFGSADEVVREGLRLLQKQDQQWSAEAGRKIDEGWTQAKSGLLRTPEQVRENLAARQETWKTARDPA